MTSVAFSGHAQINRPASSTPPNNLSPKEVPQFLVIGADDNSISGDMPGDGNAMRWLMNYLSPLKNPKGTGNAATFDQTPVRMTFFCNTMYFSNAPAEAPYLLMKIYNEAYLQGHEFANHTHSHPHGLELSVEEWTNEMLKCTDLYSKPLPALPIDSNTNCLYGAGIPASAIKGFRTPYLEYEDNTMHAAHNLKFLYESSIEEGYQKNQNGTNFFWPYTLDDGSPGHEIIKKRGGKKTSIGNYPGLWEIPTWCLITPPDDLCEQYGATKGLRKRMAERMADYDSLNGKVTGFDYNLWTDYALNYKEVLAILKYTFDLRYENNRCPMMLGMHTPYYHPSYDGLKAATVREAQMALEEFITYALSKSDTRIVPAVQLINWLTHPVALKK